MDGALLLIPLALGVALLVRVLAGVVDQGRIRDYVEERGGRVLSCRWAPFGPGWFGEKSDRIYSLRFTDRDGNVHDAHCKTSLWTGVYLTEDHIVEYARGPEPATANDRVESLEVENRQLREELARLKQQRGDRA
ncbi:MAG: hypothetical protein U0746_03890 [Gemmataceae bacterium]